MLFAPRKNPLHLLRLKPSTTGPTSDTESPRSDAAARCLLRHPSRRSCARAESPSRVMAFSSSFPAKSGNACESSSASSARSRKSSSRCGTVRVACLARQSPVGSACGGSREESQEGRVGAPSSNNRMWIAAHAKAAGLTLVTNNEKEFRRVRGLKVENWAV
jgi:hypothetical protein